MRLEPSTRCIVINGPRDDLGRASFTMYWLDPHGVFRPEPSEHDGAPVGYRRGQCFRAVPEEFVRNNDRTMIVANDRDAMCIAWGGG